MCRLYGVSEENYTAELKGQGGQEDFTREVDFYLLKDGAQYKCEVKLIGKGNPESADAVIARDSAVFVADKLSEMNKQRFDSLDVEWVELRTADGFQKFRAVLERLGIPFTEVDLRNLDSEVERIFDDIFDS